MAFDISKCDFCGECLERCHYAAYTKEQGQEYLAELLTLTQQLRRCKEL